MSTWNNSNHTTIGFTEFNGAQKVHDINVKHTISGSIVINSNALELKGITLEKIAHELAYTILEQKLPRIEEYKEQESGNVVVHATLNVASPGIKMVNVKDEVFNLNGQNFNENQIAHALLNTYPEQFI